MKTHQTEQRRTPTSKKETNYLLHMRSGMGCNFIRINVGIKIVSINKKPKHDVKLRKENSNRIGNKVYFRSLNT